MEAVTMVADLPNTGMEQSVRRPENTKHMPHNVLPTVQKIFLQDILLHTFFGILEIVREMIIIYEAIPIWNEYEILISVNLER